MVTPSYTHWSQRSKCSTVWLVDYVGKILGINLHWILWDWIVRNEGSTHALGLFLRRHSRLDSSLVYCRVEPASLALWRLDWFFLFDNCDARFKGVKIIFTESRSPCTRLSWLFQWRRDYLFIIQSGWPWAESNQYWVVVSRVGCIVAMFAASSSWRGSNYRCCWVGRHTIFFSESDRELNSESD